MRHYKRKRPDPPWTREDIKNAVMEVCGGQTCNAVAKKYKIPRSSLQKKVELYLKSKDANFYLRKPGKKVFNEEQENRLIGILHQYETELLGITEYGVRKIAFQLASQLRLKHNFNMQNQIAGKDWLQNFLQRHPEIKLRRADRHSKEAYNQLEPIIITKTEPSSSFIETFIEFPKTESANFLPEDDDQSNNVEVFEIMDSPGNVADNSRERSSPVSSIEEFTPPPPTVSERRSKNNELTLKQAADSILRGSTYHDISKQFNISETSLRFYMARMGYLQQGEFQLPLWFEWEDVNSGLKEAAEEVTQGTMFADAAKNHNLPIYVVYNYMRDKGLINEPQSIISPETSQRDDLRKKDPADMFFVFCNEVPREESSLDYYRKLSKEELLRLVEYMAFNEVYVKKSIMENILDGTENLSTQPLTQFKF